jgi:hypothetical protein
MNSHSKKVISISILTAIPLVVIVFRSFIITRRGWSTPEIQFQTIYWMVRVALAPLVVLYIVGFWTDVNRFFLLSLRQLTGFSSYLFLHWSISFILCKLLLTDFDPRNWNLFNIIKNESSQLNFLCYTISVFVFYLWVYVERYGKASGQAALLEGELTDSKRESLNQKKNLESKLPKDKLDKLTIKTGSKVNIVPVQSITYLQADGPYVKIVTNDKVHLLNTPLYELQKQLPESLL